MNVGMQLSTRQQLAMTPELQHSIWLLQLSGVEFEQAVEDALVANPFLERDESEGNRSSDAAEDGSPSDFAGSTLTAPATSADEQSSDSPPTIALETPDAADDLDTGEWPRATASRSDDDEQGFGSFSPAPVGLRENLLQQIGACRLEPRDRELAELIAHALDPDGYLRESFDDLRALVSPPAEDDELEIALRRVQSLEPAGVGARRGDAWGWAAAAGSTRYWCQNHTIP